MKIKHLLFFLISQILLLNSVSAYYVNGPYGVNNGQFSYGYVSPYYGYAYPYYANTYYGSSNTVSTGPRTITIECKDNNPPGAPGTASYMVYYSPTCNSTTGEGSPDSYLYSSQNSQGQPTFSGHSNYRCINYYYNGQCSIYRYDTTYTPPLSSTAYTTNNYNQYPTTYSWSTYGTSQYTYAQ